MVPLSASIGTLDRWCSKLSTVRPQGFYSALWSEWVTTTHTLGCSPYFTVHGVHPILSFNINKATYLVPLPNAVLSNEDLLTRQGKEFLKHQPDLDKLWQCVCPIWITLHETMPLRSRTTISLWKVLCWSETLILRSLLIARCARNILVLWSSSHAIMVALTFLLNSLGQSYSNQSVHFELSPIIHNVPSSYHP